MTQPILVMIHVLAATIWTGGHLVLATRILPLALQQKSPEIVVNFESRYEGIGIPALLVQIITGFWLAVLRLNTSADNQVDFSSTAAILVLAKVILLVATMILAYQARFRHIPELNAERLPALAKHIIGVTVLAVLFVVVGVFLRFVH